MHALSQILRFSSSRSCAQSCDQQNRLLLAYGVLPTPLLSPFLIPTWLRECRRAAASSTVPQSGNLDRQHGSRPRNSREGCRRVCQFVTVLALGLRRIQVSLAT